MTLALCVAALDERRNTDVIVCRCRLIVTTAEGITHTRRPLREPRKWSDVTGSFGSCPEVDDVPACNGFEAAVRAKSFHANLQVTPGRP